MTTTTWQLPEPLRALLQAAAWHRRLLAAGCAAAAVAFGLSVLAPAPPPAINVVAAVRDLVAGATLTDADVHIMRIAPREVPSGAMRATTAVVGRVLASAARRGEVLTDVRLVGPSLVGSLASAGLVATPVRIADPGAARLLQPGDVVDVLASSDHGDAAAAPVVAAGVRVVTVPAPDGGAGLDDGALVVLATTPSIAAVLARAAVTARLSLTIRGG